MTNYSKKLISERYPKLDIFWLKNHGYFDGRKTGVIDYSDSWKNKNSIRIEMLLSGEEKEIRLLYTCTRSDTDKKSLDYTMPLVTIPCNLGGVRYWFRCLYCLERAGVVYIARDELFYCRECNNMTYYSRVKNRRNFGLFVY